MENWLSPSTIAFSCMSYQKRRYSIQIDIYGHGGSPINKAGFSPPNMVVLYLTVGKKAFHHGKSGIQRIHQ